MRNGHVWFVRLVIVYALLIFAFLASLYVIEPLEPIEKFGISASGVPESGNFLRTGPGAMFLSLAVTALYGLLRPARLISCLWFIVVLNGCIVAGRLYGMAVDGVTPLQLSELRDEGLSWIVFVLALLAWPRAARAHTAPG